MDLKAILESNKSKLKQTHATHKPPSIAREDRPYSISLDSSMEETCSALIASRKEAATNWQQIGNKVKPNLSQSRAKLEPIHCEEETGSKVVANWEQSDSKLVAKREQTGSKVVAKSLPRNRNWEQTGSTTDSTIDSKVVANWEQTGRKLVAKSTFSQLVGLQHEIIVFISTECKNSRSRITDCLSMEYIAKAVKHSTGSIKNAINRLEKKGCLFRVEFKNGRGGWSRYELPDSIYNDALRIESGSKVVANWEQSGSKVVAQPIAQLIASPPSSSSHLNIKETTTTELGEEWKFDISEYAKFGFSYSQLKQLAGIPIPSSTVEQSLIEFNFDYENSSLPKIIGSNIIFLMGILRKGAAYTSEAYNKHQRDEISRMASIAEGARQKRLEERFTVWVENLSEEEIQKIEKRLPTSLIVLCGTCPASKFDHVEVRKWLFDYYLSSSGK